MKEIVLRDGFVVHMGPHGNSISIDAEVALKVIGQKFGLHYTAADQRDVRVVVAGVPEMPALELQEDISRHGSPCWNTVEILTTDLKEIEAYKNFQAIMKYIREKENEEK